MTSYVYLSGSHARKPNEAEREHIDRFVAAFVAKKRLPPSCHWKVPRVGYLSSRRLIATT